MPRKPSLEDVDALATKTAKRLDRHVARSGERHRTHSSKIASLEKRMGELEVEVRILRARIGTVRPTQ